MGKTFLGVRDVDEEELRRFKAFAVEEKVRLGEAITRAMKIYRSEVKIRKKKNDPRNLLKLTGIITTKEKVRWSEEIDDILYG